MPLVLGNIRVNIALCDASAAMTSKKAPPRTGRSFLAEAPGSNGNGITSPATLPTAVLFSEATQLSAPTEDSTQKNSFNNANNNNNTSIDTMPRDIRVGPNPLMIEPPRWAVPAKGEARLEPVCEAVGSHPIVDLTRSPCVRVGRSPTSDLQLMNRTSSRRHALLFHHPNGSCYIVDCGSAHGTYVNGVRISSTHVSGRVIPYRVRRGALIRFGGPGAPAFVLKCHAVGFSHLIPDFSLEDEEEKTMPSSHPTLSPTLGVQLSRRLQALRPVNQTSVVGGGILKKRSWDSMDEAEEWESSRKRSRCESPDPESEALPLHLVSPELSSSSSLASMEAPRRVTFNDRLVHAITYTTSEESGDDDEEES